MTNPRKSSDFIFGIDRQQIYGGLVLPCLIGLVVYFIKDFADTSATAQNLADNRDRSLLVAHSRDREIDDIKARVLSLERECRRDR